MKVEDADGQRGRLVAASPNVMPRALRPSRMGARSRKPGRATQYHHGHVKLGRERSAGAVRHPSDVDTTADSIWRRTAGGGAGACAVGAAVQAGVAP